VEDESFPGEEAMRATAMDRCQAAWESLPEPDMDNNGLAQIGISSLYPSEATWEQGDREVVCYISTRDRTDGIQGNFQDGSAQYVG
jgi:hypothetical protein